MKQQNYSKAHSDQINITNKQLTILMCIRRLILVLRLRITITVFRRISILCRSCLHRTTDFGYVTQYILH